MITITLLLCLIAVCLSGHYEEHSYGKMNTIELDHIDEKRNILGGTSDLKSCDNDLIDIIERLLGEIVKILNKCPQDNPTIINLQGVVTGLLRTVANLVNSLLALVGAILGNIIDSLITCNTDLKNLLTSLDNVVTQLTQDLTPIICSLVGTVDDLAGNIDGILNELAPVLDQLKQIVGDITDQRLCTIVQDVINILDPLTTKIGTLVSHLLSAVLKLVAEILSLLKTNIVPLLNQLIQELRGKTEISPEQIQSCNTLANLLANLLKSVDDLLAQLTNNLLPGINLPELLEPLNDAVNNLLSELIEILDGIVGSVDLAPILATLKKHQQDLSQRVGQISSS